MEKKDLFQDLSRLIHINLNFQKLNKYFELKYGLSIIQWHVLNVLIETPGISPQALARVLMVSPGTLTQTLNRLHKKKYIFICDDPSDARKKVISITRKGKEKLDNTFLSLELIFNNINSEEHELEKIDQYLSEIVKNLIPSRLIVNRQIPLM